MIVKFTGPLKPIKHKDSQALVVNFEYLISRPHLGKDPSTPLLKASGPRPLIYKWGNWGLLKFSDLPKFTSSHFPARIHGCHTSWIACASWFQTEHGSMPCCCQCRGGWGILKQCSEQILEGKWKNRCRGESTKHWDGKISRKTATGLTDSAWKEKHRELSKQKMSITLDMARKTEFLGVSRWLRCPYY